MEASQHAALFKLPLAAPEQTASPVQGEVPRSGGGVVLRWFPPHQPSAAIAADASFPSRGSLHYVRPPRKKPSPCTPRAFATAAKSKIWAVAGRRRCHGAAVTDEVSFPRTRRVRCHRAAGGGGRSAASSAQAAHPSPRRMRHVSLVALRLLFPRQTLTLVCRGSPDRKRGPREEVPRLPRPTGAGGGWHDGGQGRPLRR